MLSIAFLHNNHNHPGYTGAAIETAGVGGTESSVIHLAEALAARGHRVRALNRLAGVNEENGVTWMPLHEGVRVPMADIAIGINSSRVFWGLPSRRKIAWLHNPPNLRQQLKRRNLFALLVHRPHVVLLSRYQCELLQRWLPYSGRSVLHHGIADAFFMTQPESAPRPMRAVFTSQPGRGLAFVAECWETIIASVPSAELHIFCPQAKQEEAAKVCAGRKGIIVRGSVNRRQLAQELRLARMMLIPGVADETFCLAAAEATVSGVPIVTLGIGALSERVEHGKTGFIVETAGDFASCAALLLRDEAVWSAQHAACIAGRRYRSWAEQAVEWEALFRRLLGSPQLP